MPVVDTPRHKAFIDLLHARLPEKRATHCIYVAEYLSSFAVSIGLDHDKAVTAGLLHDLCRTLSNEAMLARAKEYGVSLTELSRERPILLHGPVAAAEIRRDLGIDDPDILEAIAWHTGGRRGLCLLGCALYVADFAEPGRNYPEAAEARDRLQTVGFDDALDYAARCKHERAMTCGKVMDPDAQDFFNWIQERRG